MNLYIFLPEYAHCGGLVGIIADSQKKAVKLLQNTSDYKHFWTQRRRKPPEPHYVLKLDLKYKKCRLRFSHIYDA